MKPPKGLQPLIDEGIVDEVVRSLKSGKEAAVFVVRAGSRTLCAKVYKEANHRGFHKLAEYQEGRKRRGSRDQRALNSRSRRGRAVQEEAWKNAEVDALYQLEAAGVRVPKPHGCFDGVLLMEMVVDASGQVAPRLNDVDPSPEQAREWHAFLMNQVVRMLCVGLVHGDLSEFNVLIDAHGPVIIDLPQAVNVSGNNNAFRMLARDVENITAYCGRSAPELLTTRYAPEIWKLFQESTLTPETPLTGQYVDEAGSADIDDVLNQIEEARREAERRQRGRELAEAMDAPE